MVKNNPKNLVSKYNFFKNYTKIIKVLFLKYDDIRWKNVRRQLKAIIHLKFTITQGFENKTNCMEINSDNSDGLIV